MKRRDNEGRLRRVVRASFGRRALRDDVDAEVRFHIEGRIEELISMGRSREEAEREARTRFGDVRRIESELETIDRGTQRRRSWRDRLDSVATDARHALRGMARRPFHTAAIIGTLALGIGANTAIFSGVNTVLLHPLPTAGLDRIVFIREDLPGLDLHDAALSPGESQDLLARKDLFQSAAAYTGSSFGLTGLGDPQRLSVTFTMGDFFSLFGVRPLVGRLYRPEDSAPGAPHVVVLTYALWQQIAGGSLNIVGRSIALDDVRYEVIGVLPPEFRFPRAAQAFMPYELSAQRLSDQWRGTLIMNFVGRMRDGIEPPQLAAQLAVEISRWRDRFSFYEHFKTVLLAVPLVNQISGELRPILLALMGAVGFVLLIACANVASLQLVRAAGRAKELALRAALGAGRGAIARQLLVESALLAAAGGALGLLVGEGLVRVLAARDPGRFEALREIHADVRVLGYTAAIAIVAGLLFGGLPAWRASRVNLQDALKDSMRGSSLGSGRQRLLQGSVVVQLALTLVLLLASMLTVRSLARLLETDPGFRPDGVVMATVSLPYSRYATNASRRAFFDGLVTRLRANPFVQSVGLVGFPPLAGGSGASSPFELPGRPVRSGEPARHANFQFVDADYLRAMGVPLLRGRVFDAGDAEGAPAVLVDEHLAKSFFGNEDPIGKQITQNGPATIVGVVGNVTRDALDEPHHPTIYYPYARAPWMSFATVVVRSPLPGTAAAGEVRTAVKAMDAALPLYDVMPLRARVDASVAARRLAMFVLAGFAALSLVLALLGVYGVISYATAQRTQEIGIRMALGAEPPVVARMVLGGGLSLAFVGLGAGALLFLGVGRVMGSLLYGISPRDPVTMAAGVAVLGVAALLASYLPARRAARVDPLVALRAE